MIQDITKLPVGLYRVLFNFLACSTKEEPSPIPPAPTIISYLMKIPYPLMKKNIVRTNTLQQNLWRWKMSVTLVQQENEYTWKPII